MANKDWIKYEPEKENIRNTKMCLRNMVNNIAILCPSIQISYTQKSDYNDDTYNLIVDVHILTLVIPLVLRLQLHKLFLM